MVYERGLFKIKDIGMETFKIGDKVVIDSECTCPTCTKLEGSICIITDILGSGEIFLDIGEGGVWDCGHLKHANKWRDILI